MLLCSSDLSYRPAKVRALYCASFKYVDPIADLSDLFVFSFLNLTMPFPARVKAANSLLLFNESQTRQRTMKFHLSLHVYCHFADYFEADRGVDFGLSFALLRAQAVRHFESLRNHPEPGTTYPKQGRQDGG